jgi:hypothetical protein
MEDLYEVTGFHNVSVSSVKIFAPQMALVVDSICLHNFLPHFIALVLMHLVCWLCL